MASFRRHKNGWRAEVFKAGIRKSMVWQTKAQAQSWAASVEAEIVEKRFNNYPRKTLSEAFQKYAQDHKIERADRLRLGKFERLFPTLASKVLSEITVADVVAWRDARQKEVKPNTIRREVNQISQIVSTAAKEWLWCDPKTPWLEAPRPKASPARSRRASWREIKLLLRNFGYATLKPPENQMQKVAWLFLMTQHTALRAQEARLLEIRDIDLNHNVLTIRKHKTDKDVGQRVVPFTRKAARLFKVLISDAKASKRTRLVEIGAASLDALFRKTRDRVMIEDYHFHDSRADALTRLSRRVDVMELARISGHKNIQLLYDTYYRTRPQEIAKKL